MDYLTASQIVVSAAHRIAKRDRVSFDVAWYRLQRERPDLLTALETVRKRELGQRLGSRAENLKKTFAKLYPGRGLENDPRFIKAVLSEIERRAGDVDWYELLQTLRPRFPSLLSFVQKRGEQ